MHSDGVARGLTIGEFSRITHLSVRMLRRYHESGLLEPATVDPDSGYRYYSPDQVPTAQVIRAFRELDMPVADVRAIVRTPEPDGRAALVESHLHRLEAELDRTRAAVTSLRRLLHPAPTPLEVELRRTEPREVAAVTGTVDHGDVLAWFAAAAAEIDDAVAGAGAAVTGPRGGVYAHELFTAERGDVLIHRPVDHAPTVGRVRPHVLPAVELAVAVHRGPHDDIDVTYGELGRWVDRQALAISGPVHESYLVGPEHTDDATAWRTEIGWPVFATRAP